MAGENSTKTREIRRRQKPLRQLYLDLITCSRHALNVASITNGVFTCGSTFPSGKFQLIQDADHRRVPASCNGRLRQRVPHASPNVCFVESSDFRGPAYAAPQCVLERGPGRETQPFVSLFLCACRTRLRMGKLIALRGNRYRL